MNMDLRDKGRFWKAFKFAFQGIMHACKTERNVQFHFAASVIVILFSIYLNISLFEWLFICLCIFGVITLELINSAIERIVDLASPSYHPLAKQAKDIAAGAVLVYSIMTVIIGSIIFLPKLARLFQSYIG
ncbi:diacylglycerol kinase family protein [Heyndrickxia oleronia]|uniref:Diacylglycerol kinase family protein n=1 Tax=Heyndrickxia oleronia TaxID=38875 RepID=A0AAW6SN00_9BACI|nr:diacylglycerol kinase family protein [Heyndrickxia oleronia]MCM3237040.1 diacylglycerol kinase family protein [Heyndrickxia oleronia]MDH5160165.1 diacylglycerol kinase family protein [Heyndrickxia oleronia]